MSGASSTELLQLGPLPHPARLILAARPGLVVQRNAGLKVLEEASSAEQTERLVAFIGDAFRPSTDWLEQAVIAFARHFELAGLTERGLASGVSGAPLSEADARTLLRGDEPARPQWSVGPAREVWSLYGCNMALRKSLSRACRFNEGLPAYGWPEHFGVSGQARRFGRTRLVPHSRGVHRFETDARAVSK